MDDSLIVDLFWQRSEDALTVCAERFGAYCRIIAVNENTPAFQNAVCQGVK